MLGRLFEALDIGSAGSDFNIVVQYSVEDADWMVRDFGVADVSRGARRIESNIGGRIDPAWVPQLMESFGKRGKTSGGMILRFSGGRESDSFWEWRRPGILTVCRTPS
jgi:hypothetical protein